LDDLLRTRPTCATASVQVTFTAWNGTPILQRKAARLHHPPRLRHILRSDAWKTVRTRYRHVDDDILNAFAALWTVERVPRRAQSLPKQLALDAKRLSMG
jgi:hypothetical protein